MVQGGRFVFSRYLSGPMRHIFVLLAFIAVYYLAALFYFERNRNTLDGSDSWGYYIHLPSVLLYQDVGDYSRTISVWQTHYPNRADPRIDKYGIRPTPTGKSAVKYPIGVAILELPFFLAAHLYCTVLGTVPADGFSAPYGWAVAFSSVFYAILGLFFVFQLLRYYYSERISLVVTATLGLATNLIFFCSFTLGMAHPIAFCLVAFFLLSTIRWFDKPNVRQAAYLGLTLGLIALVRTQDLLIVLAPLLLGVNSWKSFQQRLGFVWDQKNSLAIAVLAFGLVLVPQSIYWKTVADEWWRYGYQGETFTWLRPHLWQGLFSFQNGWLIYTPVMVFSMLGLFRLRRFAPDWVLPILVFLPPYWYVIYSWWCWQYINGFGSRPMIDTYALLALPLAAWLASTKRLWVYGILIAFLAGLMSFQMWQFNKGLFWTERGNYAYYRATFGKTKADEAILTAFESNEVQPPAGLEKVRDLTLLATADTSAKNYTFKAEKSANHVMEEFNLMHNVSNDTAKLVGGDWLRISATAFAPHDAPILSMDDVAKLVIDFSDSRDKLLKYRSIRVVSHLDNPGFSIWRTHGTGKWDEAAFFVMVPAGFDVNSRLKTYIWNPRGQELFVHNIKVEFWK